MKNTIKLFIMVVLAACIMVANPVYAQNNKAQKKENKELKKDQKELHAAVYQKTEKKSSVWYVNLI